MESYLQKTKLHLPSIPPKSLFTDRLRDLAIDENRLSILLAPGGFGKTTAVLLSLQEKRERVRWYRLEPEDRFLDIFYHHLIYMLFSSAPEITQEEIKLLFSLQDLQEESPILNAQICQDMTYLHAQDEEPLYLVFDDFQYLGDDIVFSQMFSYFVANMPDCVRIIITSRTDPRFLTAKNCLHYLCRQYDSSNLLFAPEEVKKLVDEVYQFSFTEAQLDFIEKRCKGWAAGIYILSHSLHTKSSINDTEDLLPEAQSLFSLFFQEYFLHIDEHKKERLLELSLLDDFSIDELRDLFLEEHPKEFLQWLEINQLCFQTSSEEKTRYYFHSLLLDELRELHGSTYTSSEQKELYLRIAEYYLAKDLQKALYFYIQAGEMDKSFELAADFAKDCFSSGQPECFFPILSLYTEEQIQQNPYLLLMEGMKEININRLRAQTCFMQALEAFNKGHNHAYLMNSFGMLLVVAYQLNDFELLQEAYKSIPVSSILLKGGPARTQLIISYFISLIGEDNIKRAGFLTDYLDHKKIDEKMWQFSYLMIRGIYHYRKGDLAKSRHNLQRILAHPVMQLGDQWRIIGLVSCCNLAFLQADLELITYFINEFTLLAELLHSDFTLGYAHYMRSFYYYLQDNVQEAQSSLLLCIEAFKAFGSQLLVMESECLYYLMGKEVEEEQILRLRSILDQMKIEKPGHGLEEFTEAVLGIQLKRQGKYNLAEKHLLHSLKVSQEKGAMQSVYSLYLQLADLYLLMGEKLFATEYFAKWVALGKKKGYVYGRKFTHDALLSVMERLPNKWKQCSYCHGITKFYEEARQKARSERVIEATFLGPFSLQIGSLILTEKDFKTRKVSGLLKYILVRQGFQSREYLASIFWPEADRKSANTSLRVALYELRKSLASFGMGFDTESALLEETKDGFALCDAALFSDTKRLEELYGKWQASNEKDLSLLMEICRVYQGPFLEKGDYDDWVTIQREYYAGIYFEALHALGEEAVEQLYLPAAECLQRGLELDALDEKSYGHLINLFEKTGQSDRAISLRKQFKKRFKAEMGFEAKV